MCLAYTEKALICVCKHEPPKQSAVTMNYVCTLILSLAMMEAAAQLPKLEPSNPAPRQGEEINITFVLKDAGADIGNGNLKLRQPLTDTGMVKIGPFQFSVDDKTYATGTLALRVYPKLPDNVHEGIWIRYVLFEGKHYLITEQRVSGDPKKKSSEATILSTDGAVFAELDRDRFEEAGLKIVYSNSFSASQVMDKDEVNYKLTTYKFEKTPFFKGKIKVDKKLFSDFPDKLITPEVWIGAN
jgi:hypothetical protein